MCSGPEMPLSTEARITHTETIGFDCGVHQRSPTIAEGMTGTWSDCSPTQRASNGLLWARWLTGTATLMVMANLVICQNVGIQRGCRDFHGEFTDERFLPHESEHPR